jgi:hypothetical protein
MPKIVIVTVENVGWLRDHHKDHSYTELAQHFNCCVDTLKRILMREGIEYFDGAKYQVKRHAKVKNWNRPCMSCGDSKDRPHGWYFCRPCRSKFGYDD